MGDGKYNPTRRTALKATAAVGSMIGFSYTVSAGDDTIEVPVAVRGDETLATREVDEEWWEHVEQSRKIIGL